MRVHAVCPRLAAALVLTLSAAAQCAPYVDPFPSFLDGTSLAVVVMPSGDVVYGGEFDNVGNHVARWDGAAWHAMADGLDGKVNDLVVLPDGDVVACGVFSSSGATSVNNVARWDGTSWQPMGAGVGQAPSGVQRLLLRENGDLLVGGFAGSAPLMQWDGTSWLPLGGSATNGDVRALHEMPNGDLLVAGAFTTIDGVNANRIARWDGTAWHSLGSGLDAPVFDLATLADGSIIACGLFTTAGGAPASRVARWTGSQWQPMGLGVGPLSAIKLLPLSGVDVLMGGSFLTAGGQTIRRLARWDGQAWRPFAAPSFPLTIWDLCEAPDGTIYAAGFDLSNGNISRIRVPCPSSIETTFDGCTSAGSAPELIPWSLPRLGVQMYSGVRGLPDGLAVCVASESMSAPLPLAQLFPSPTGCELAVTPFVLDLLVPNGGWSQWSVSIPNDTSLIGETFHHQVVAFELSAAGIVEATSSNRLSWTIGGL